MPVTTIDPKILDAANGITYSKPKLLDRLKMLIGIKFVPKKLESILLMDLIPRLDNMMLGYKLPKYAGPMYKIGSVATE